MDTALPSLPSGTVWITACTKHRVATAPTNPPAARAQAEDILAMLKPFDPVINELIQARKDRPHIRFNVRYERHLEALLPHLSAMKNTVVTHRDRGIVRLALDDTAGALEDLEMCLFLCRGLSIEPGWLISRLVALATHNISMQLVFNGLSTRKWNETQLAVIEKELSQFDWLALYHYAMRGTRNETLAFFQEMAGNRLRTHKKFDKFVMTDVPKTVLWVPGALQENQNKIVRLYDERVFALVNLKTRTVDVRLAKHFVIRRFESKHLNEVLASDLFYGQENLALKTARAQVANDLARLAVALERHRRAEGDYPEKLAALAPRFLAKIPHDVMNGKPLNYKRLNDDYLLYSVGQNLRDDGGLIVEKDYHAGDIRWFAKPKPQPKPKAE